MTNHQSTATSAGPDKAGRTNRIQLDLDANTCTALDALDTDSIDDMLSTGVWSIITQKQPANPAPPSAGRPNRRKRWSYTFDWAGPDGTLDIFRTLSRAHRIPGRSIVAAGLDPANKLALDAERQNTGFANGPLEDTIAALSCAATALDISGAPLKRYFKNPVVHDDEVLDTAYSAITFSEPDDATTWQLGSPWLADTIRLLPKEQWHHHWKKIRAIYARYISERRKIALTAVLHRYVAPPTLRNELLARLENN